MVRKRKQWAPGVWFPRIQIAATRQDATVGLSILIGVVLIVGLHQLVFESPLYRAGKEIAILKAAKDRVVVFAGHAIAGASLGNPEGFQAGKTVNYTVPPNIQPGQLILAGWWRNDPKAMMHEGRQQGVAFLGFSGSSVDMIAAPGSEPAFVWVFYDGNFAPQSVLGEDVRVNDQRPTITVAKAGRYRVLRDVPAGPHLVGIATNASGFSLYALSVVSPEGDGSARFFESMKQY